MGRTAVGQGSVKSHWEPPNVAVLGTTQGAMGGELNNTADGVFCEGVEGFQS